MKNVVLITVDCFRRDCFNKPLTPNLWGLGEQGVFMKNAFSVASWTAPSFIGLLTSSYPLLYGGNLKIARPRVSLPEVLKDSGYHTVGFTYHPYLNRIYGYGRGFDEYFDEIGGYSSTSTGLLNKLKDITKKYLAGTWISKKLEYINYVKFLEHKLKTDFRFYKPSAEINENIVSYLSGLKAQKPFFLWVHYMDAHFPYISGDFNRDEMIELNVERERWFRGSKPVDEEKLQRLRKLYEHKIGELDEQVSNLIRRLEELYPDTLFVLTADHGEEFHEHGGFHHELSLYDELIHIPLLFYNVDISPNHESLVSNLDVAPTVLDVLGVQKPDIWCGESILQGKRSHVVSEEGQTYRGESRKEEGKFRFHLESAKIAVRDKRHKLVHSEYTEDELYDTLEDPAEGNNSISQGIPKNLKKALMDHIDLIEASSREHLLNFDTERL